MGFGKTKTVTSPFQTVKEYRVNLGALGHGIASSDGNTLNNWYVATPQIAAAQKASVESLGQNMAVLKQSPTAQLEELNAGKNSFYNLSKQQLDRDVTSQLGQAQVRFSRQGLQNSTTSGAFQGQIASQATLRDLMNRFSSLDYLNQTARQNAASAMDTLAGLTDIAQSTASMAGNNLMAGFGNRSQSDQFNAQQQNQSNRAKLSAVTSLGGLLNPISESIASRIERR